MVLLRFVFLGNEYSSEFFQTLLAVLNFTNQRCFTVNFAKFSRTPFFHWTLLVAAPEKLKARAVIMSGVVL